MSIRHGVLIENVSRTDAPAVLEVTSSTKFIVPTGVPIQNEGQILWNKWRKRARLMNGNGSDPIPVGIIGIKLKIPSRCGSIRYPDHRVQGKMEPCISVKLLLRKSRYHSSTWQWQGNVVAEPRAAFHVDRRR